MNQNLSSSNRPVVAVTGADGFIGSHLTEELVRAGYRVKAMAIYNSQGSYGWLDTVPGEVMEHVEVQLGDVRDAGSVRALMRDAETVYHLAALIAIPYSYVAPRSYVDTNVSGTLNVLEAARDLGTGRVIHTSTSEVYGTARTVPIHESHPLQGQSPYSASKIGADQLAQSFYQSFETPVATIRPFNTYGPRQSARAAIVANYADDDDDGGDAQDGEVPPRGAADDEDARGDRRRAVVELGLARDDRRDALGGLGEHRQRSGRLRCLVRDGLVAHRRRPGRAVTPAGRGGSPPTVPSR